MRALGEKYSLKTCRISRIESPHYNFLKQRKRLRHKLQNKKGEPMFVNFHAKITTNR
jgi:hypothetical protein